MLNILLRARAGAASRYSSTKMMRLLAALAPQHLLNETAFFRFRENKTPIFSKNFPKIS
jgi:hypothetical protein